MKPVILFLVAPFFIGIKADIVETVQKLADVVEDVNETYCKAEVERVFDCHMPHIDFLVILFRQKNESMFYNIGLMRKALEVGKNVTECIGSNVKCSLPKIELYVLNSLIYAGGKVYGDAFHCFINAKFVESFESCEITTPLSGLEEKEMVRNPSTFAKAVQPFVECIAHKLYETPSCTVDRIFDLYQAGRVGFDAYYKFLRSGDNQTVSWDFDEENYCSN